MVMDSMNRQGHHTLILIITMIVLFSGYIALINCNVSNRLESESLSPSERYLQFLEELEFQAKKEIIRYVPLYRKVAAPLKQFHSAKVLRDLFYECEARQNLPVPPIDLYEPPHGVAQTAIVTRLGELQNQEAAICLIQLFEDDQLHFDGEGALSLMHCISACGENALCPLTKVSGSRRIFVPGLVTAIKDGELYGL